MSGINVLNLQEIDKNNCSTIMDALTGAIFTSEAVALNLVTIWEICVVHTIWQYF